MKAIVQLLLIIISIILIIIGFLYDAGHASTAHPQFPLIALFLVILGVIGIIFSLSWAKKKGGR